MIKRTLDRWFTEPFLQKSKKEVRKIRAMINATAPQGYVVCAKAIRDMDQCHIRQDIKVPTTIIMGDKDPACPMSASETLQSGMLNSKLILFFKDAAHL